MDDIDRAQDQAEKILAANIAAVPHDTLPATGDCYNCGASVPSGHRFCDVDCRDDYDRQIAARRRDGLHK